MGRTGGSPSAVPPVTHPARTPAGVAPEVGQGGRPPLRGPTRTATVLERITYHEERLRDGLLGVLLQVIPPSITPDHLTVLRVALAAAGALTWAAGAPLRPVLWLFALAAFSDFVDGPLARSRGLASGAGGRLDQLADVLLGGVLGVIVLAEGLVDRYLIAAMVVPQALSLMASLLRRTSVVERPTTLARLQFVLVVSGFWVALLGASMGHAAVMAAGRGLLYAEASLALVLSGLRLGGWYPPHSP